MLLRLKGGPFDGQVVEPTREGVEVPSHLAFGPRGDSVSIIGDAKTTGPFTDWRIRDPEIPAQLESSPKTYTAHYRTDRMTGDGLAEFEHFADSGTQT